MANLARLSVSIGADPTPLMSGVKRAQTSLRGFDKNTKNIGKNLSHSFQKPQKSIQGSTMAVVNFNRVIQDAPFGIMGVANNLEPLITSFQGLGDETTSTAGKMGMLLKKAFTGPGALITAVSVASSLAIVFSQKLRGMGDSGEFAKEKLEATSKVVDDLSNKFNQLAGLSPGEEIQSEIDKIDLAKQFKEQQDVARATLETNSEYRRLVSSTISLSDAERDRLDELEDTVNVYDELIQQLGFEETSMDFLTKQREKATAKLNAYNNALTDQQKTAREVQEIQAQATQTLDAYTAESEGAEKQLRSLAKSYRERISDIQEEGVLTKEQIVLVNTLKDEYDKLTKALFQASGIELPEVDVEPKVDTESAKKQVQGMSPVPKMPVEVEVEVRDFDKVADSTQTLRNNLASFKRAQDRLPIGATKAWNEIQSLIDETNNKLGITEVKAVNLSNAFQSTLTASISSFAQTLGDALSGAAGGGFFDSLLMVALDFTQQFGKLLIGAGVAALAFRNLLANPIAAIAAGTALVATTAAVRNLLKEGPQEFGGAFAKGGRPPVGKVSLVGERGPELFVPSTRGTIIPNDAFSAPQGNKMSVEVFGTLRGEDIFISSNRGGDTYGR